MTDWDWLFTACYIVIVKPLTGSFYNRHKITDRDDGQRCGRGEAQQKPRMTEIQPLQSQYHKYFNNSQLLFPVYPTWMAEIPPQGIWQIQCFVEGISGTGILLLCSKAHRG